MSSSRLFSFLVIASLVCTGILAKDLSAQQPQPTRVRGTIEKIEGSNLSIRSRDGKDVWIKIGEKTNVIGLKKINLSDIEPNAFVGVATVPLEDGSQKAVSIHVFPESARGFNEGSRGYDVRPNSSMTNGALSNRIKSVNGEVLTITYKGGEKKIIVTPETAIVRFESGELSELKNGANIVATVLEQPNGVGEAVRVNVGRDGITPAM